MNAPRYTIGGLTDSPMRIDASESRDQLALGLLPKPRMRRKLWSVVLLLVCVQAGVTALALLLLQGPWRQGFRFDHATRIGTAIKNEFDGQLLVSQNLLVQRALDRATGSGSVESALIVDGSGAVVLESGRRVAELSKAASRLAMEPAMSGGQSLADPLQGLLTLRYPLEKALGEDRFLVLGVRDLGALRAVMDGAIATSAGLAMCGLVVLPLAHRRFRRWTGGLHELHTAIRRLTLDVPLKPLAVVGDDETAYLSLAFNEMSGRLTASRRALVEANSVLEQRVADRTIELSAANAKLERQNEKLAQLTDAAMQFTDDVAHEFRTPLSVVMEFASIISDGLGGPVAPKQSEYLQFIIDASKDLAHLVDDFLDTEKLRAGTLRIERRAHKVEAIIDSVWEMISARAARGQVLLERRIDPDTPAVFADLEKVKRTLINLATNAIKFSKKGMVVTIAARPTESGAAELSVIDHGPGMSEDDVASLGDRFRQTTEGQRSSAKGFGLGLNIVRELVVMNLGELQVISRLGEGSTFAFTLPSEDSGLIIDMLLVRILQRSPAASVGALRVRCADASSDPKFIWSFLTCVGSPLELLLTCPGGDSFIVAGETTDVARWKDRIVQEHQRHRDRYPDTASLHVEAVGMWPASESKPHVLRALSGAAQPMEALA